MAAERSARGLSAARRRPRANYFLVLAALACVGLIVAFAPVALRAQQTDRAAALSGKLMCMCGCGQLLGQCNHIDCPLRGGMIKQLDADVASGESDDLILQDFVQQYGEAVLATPPAKGFNLVAWIIPGAAFAIGLCLVILVVRNWRHRSPASAAAGGAASPPIDPVQFERARQQADRETEE